MNPAAFQSALIRAVQVEERDERAKRLHATILDHLGKNAKLPWGTISNLHIHLPGEVEVRITTLVFLQDHLEVFPPDWERIVRFGRSMIGSDKSRSYFFQMVFDLVKKAYSGLECRDVIRTQGLDVMRLVSDCGPHVRRRFRLMLGQNPRSRSRWNLLPDHTPPDTPCGDDGDACIICHENTATVALAPCGHMFTCIACTRGLVKKECPTCRGAVTSALKVFK
jgi:hypothetical protein